MVKNKRIIFAVLFLGCRLLVALENTYDLIVIGAGASGLTAAQLAADFGKKVLIIERSKIGGGRIWSGDIPFKALFKNAEMLYAASHLNTVDFDMDLVELCKSYKVLAGVREIRQNIYEIIAKGLEKHRRISVKVGTPEFINENQVKLDDEIFSADYFLIATGAGPFIPPLKGIESVSYLSRENFFELETLPSSLIIVGGGPLGIEMASGLSKMGVKVKLIMKHGMLLPIADFQLVEILTESLVEDGVEVYCDMSATSIENIENGVRVSALNRAGKIFKYEAEQVFFATGSRPNVGDLSLERAGVKYTQKGIAVDENLRTSNSKIYAIGDVVGALTLSRVAYYHAKAAIFNIYKNSHQKMHEINYKSVPRVIFSQPPLAFLGLNEQEAYKIYGLNLKVYCYDYKLLEKAHIDQNTRGTAKFICSPDGILVGAHILGASAGDLIDTMKLDVPFNSIFFDELERIRTSPSYFDLIPRVAYLCEQDFPRVEVASNWWGGLKELFGLSKKNDPFI